MTDSVQIFPPGFRIPDTAGNPLPGAILYFYDAGTTTPKTVYSNSGLSTSLGTAVTADSAGYPIQALKFGIHIERCSEGEAAIGGL